MPYLHFFTYFFYLLTYLLMPYEPLHPTHAPPFAERFARGT